MNGGLGGGSSGWDVKEGTTVSSPETKTQSESGFWGMPREPIPKKVSEGRPVGGPAVQRLVRERPMFISTFDRRLIEAVVFLGILWLLFVFFRPNLLFSETTTTGGDTGAHIYAPWYLRNHLLPKGLLAGWSPGWYAGFPILHFYFPLIATFQALLSYLISYEVAFKLGTVLGTFFFPVSVYLLFKLLRFGFPAPIVGSILSIGFLFMSSFSIYGGNILSSLAGEYSFSLSLGLCLVFLGLAWGVAVEERGRPLLAAAILALAVLSHLIPVIIVVLFAPVLFVLALRAHGARRAMVRLGSVFMLAFALTAFWSIPFLARLQYSADMSWIPLEGWGTLLPQELWIYLLGSVLAIGIAIMRRDARLLFFIVPAALGLVLYFAVPQGHVWNGRFAPFWYLGAFLCTAYLIGTTIPTVIRFISRRRALALAAVMVPGLAIAMGGWILWNKHETPIASWIQHNYEGYEAKRSYPTFDALMERMARLPRGRVMWEPSDQLGKFGTPIALMSLPYWTEQPSMEGIYFESSITTPFHFLTAAEVAERPSNPIPGLPYHEFDLQRGTRHMELLDVSYYVTFSRRAREAALRSDRLEKIDDVGEFSIFAVRSPGQVVVPKYQPVVLQGADWTEANVQWFSKMDNLEVPLVRGGPEAWPRAKSGVKLPKSPLPEGGRSFDAEMDDDEIAFTTSAVGQPHWIKTSYFPNWQVEGAEGPFLASPSMMMVVPTQPDVRLHYERTWAEWTGLGLTIAALAALLWPRTRRRIAQLADA